MAFNWEPLQLWDWLRNSERLPNVKVLFGPKALSVAGAPPRIVMFPGKGKNIPPSNEIDNLAGKVVEVHCHCWASGPDVGAAFDALATMIGNLEQAVLDFRLAKDINAQRSDTDTEWDITSDTNRQGEAAVVTFSVVCVTPRTPLVADAGSGTVSTEQFTPTP